MKNSPYVSEHSREKNLSQGLKHNHHEENIIRKLNEGIKLRKRVINQVLYMCCLSQIEP
jgi:hypothetical protein